MSGQMPRRDLESTLARLVAETATAQDELFNEQERWLKQLQENVDANLSSIARIVSEHRGQIFISGGTRAEIGGLWVCLSERFQFDSIQYSWMSVDQIEFYDLLATLASSAGIDAAGTSAELREFALKQPYLRRTEIITVEDRAGRTFVAELRPPTN